MYRIFDYNPQLKDFWGDIEYRMHLYHHTKWRLLQGEKSLNEFANGHDYFGFHHENGYWVYREWAPSAYQLYPHTAWGTHRVVFRMPCGTCPFPW